MIGLALIYTFLGMVSVGIFIIIISFIAWIIQKIFD